MTPSDVKATLSFSDGSAAMDLPIYKGSVGPDVIDIRKLYAQTGYFTYDPGFMATAACRSGGTTNTMKPVPPAPRSLPPSAPARCASS